MSEQTPRTGRHARPRFTDVDAWGVTHRGLRRPDNQDHFFAGALARTERGVVAVGLNEEAGLGGNAERIASLNVVADGAGGVSDGAEAARVAVHQLVAAVARLFDSGAVADPDDPDVVSRLLQDAALDCHEHLLQRARDEGGGRRFATTLTLFLGLWPHAYLLQVGDSRCYVWMNGQLAQITRDQTVAQDLVDAGALTRVVAEQSQWAHVLSSAIGGPTAAPVVTRVVRDWGTIVLLCSDGLTRHVSDDGIRQRLAAMTSAREAAEQLVQDALDGGGSDNITVVIGRTLQPGS